MSKSFNIIKTNTSNPKVWVVIGVSVVGFVVLAETLRRRRNLKLNGRVDFGAFLERFELIPFPQPPPPAARQPLAGLKFAIKDVFDVKGYVTGFGSPDWKRDHHEAERTAVVVTLLLKNGATCIGKTVLDEFAFGITGENKHYGTPVNPQMPSHIPGGSSSGSAVAVAAQLVDFALGTDTIGCVRVPASFCGILGYRPSHGTVSMIGVLPNSQSLDTVGLLARNASILHRVGHVLLQLNTVEPRRARRLIFADDIFQLSKVPKLKTIHVISKAIESLSGYQNPEHMNVGQYIASNVPSLKGLRAQSTSPENGTATLKALSSVMLSLQRYEFKTIYEEWVKSAKPRLGYNVFERVLEAINTTQDNIKILYKVRNEMRAALQRWALSRSLTVGRLVSTSSKRISQNKLESANVTALLDAYASFIIDDKILVIPTVSDPPLKLNTKKTYSAEFHDRTLVLSSIGSMSGCCQVAIPIGKYNEHPISISFITYHGGDKFLLDTVLDLYDSLQEQVNIASNLVPLPDTNGSIDASELLKEKGNAAFKGKQWNKAVNYYSEAIKLNGTSATYYSNRAAAYLELGCFQQAEEDCSKTISLDKKVRARVGYVDCSMLIYLLCIV
ncbi:Outer envelope protein 64 [Citrus sinensis]|uniref:Outer envelope protein 64 n=1 Tax=Citrus sinensis TaxID=2711 RepID=A0ACB8IMB7_CITSI|nr:Outer envelope protein 64 [Citrus sinensis]